MRRSRLTSRVAAAAALAALLAAGMAPGCTAVSRGLGKMTANKYASARSGTEWVVAPPDLEPPGAGEKTVYISYRNLSDLQDLELKSLITEAARADGWQVVAADEANYRLRATARFFGEVEVGSQGLAQARAMGVISGAAVGLGTYAGVRSVTDSGVGGAAAGAAAGGLVGVGIANASKPREWALILDFVLEQYSEEEVTFKVEVDEDSTRASGAGVSTTRGSTGGSQTGGTSTSATAERTSNYVPYGLRLSAWANQMNMKEDEAVPLIVERVERIVTQMLPQ